MQALSITEKFTHFVRRFMQFLLELLITIIECFVPPIRERRLNLEREMDLDQPTGMANRAAFDRARATAEDDKKNAFIVFDCNNFKLVNDTLGHVAGDECLFQIAAEIKLASFHYKARAFRYGGDEFVVLVSSKFAEPLRDTIERRIGENSHIVALNERLPKKISISGCVGRTFFAADRELQTRKSARKSADRTPNLQLEFC